MDKTPKRESKTTRQAEDDLLSRKIISFIKWINATFEHPANWPMTDQQRISVVGYFENSSTNFTKRLNNS